MAEVMAESSLSLTYHDFANAVSSEYGSGPDYTAITDAAELAVVDKLVQDGYRLSLFPPILPNDTQQHKWSFIRPVRNLTTVAPYSTGTITIASGSLTTVTLVDGTFPSWAADAQIIVSGRPYVVTTRVDGTHLTLAENGPEVAGVAYSLQRYYYTMDEDFGGIEGPMTYQSGYSSRPINDVGEAYIRQMQQTCNLTGRPSGYAITWDTTVQGATKSTRALIQFIPIPDQAYFFTYRCHLLPNKLDKTTLVYPIGGLEFGQVVMAACLACAEKHMNRAQGPRWQEFMVALQAAIYADRQKGPELFGPANQSFYTDADGCSFPYSPHLVVYEGMS